jgi:N-acetylneuraminic acid mutarotase
MTTSWHNIIPTNNNGNPPIRCSMGMVYNTMEATIYMYGGTGNEGGAKTIPLGDMWSYNISVPGNQWKQMMNGLINLSNMGMVYDTSNSTIYVFGGIYSSGPNQTATSDKLYSYKADTWVEVSGGVSGPPRSDMGMVYDISNSTIYIFGGIDGSNAITNQLWSYKNTIWTNITPVTSPETRYGMGMIYNTLDYKIYMFGGNNDITNLNDLWSYDTTTNSWTNLTPNPIPSIYPRGRSLFGMVYNISNNTIYIFGGIANSIIVPTPSLNETWSYNVSTNTWMNLTQLNIDTENTPLVRDSIGIVYCNFNYNMYMFGGEQNSTGANMYNDLWSLSYNYACFQQGTPIMTPAGYCCIENLKAGDDVTLYNSSGASTPIIELIHFKCDQTQCPLYCLPKDALSENIPLHDLYMAGNHAFKDLAGQWHHMKCAANVHSVNKETIDYYHIVTSDYYAHTICAEGVEVETCFTPGRIENAKSNVTFSLINAHKAGVLNEKRCTDKSDGKSLVWVCNKTCCTPYIKQSTNDSELSSITM